MPQHTFAQFIDSLFQKWGQANQHDLVANEKCMKALWDPNDQDIADVISKSMMGPYSGAMRDSSLAINCS
jgi:hypothetical protein